LPCGFRHWPELVAESGWPDESVKNRPKRSPTRLLSQW
jgi:hypothetical protein